MIFSELYGIYYKTVAKILEKSLENPISKQELREVIKEYAFEESCMNIEAALSENQWPLLLPDGTAAINNKPKMPLTTLQKRWLKTIAQDPRMRLFGEELQGLDDVEPLFHADDIVVFDQYADGDPYEDEEYIHHFRMILEAIKKQHTLKVTIRGKKREHVDLIFAPEYLEYSEKDDKFRVIGTGNGRGDTINLGRIIACKKYEKEFSPGKSAHENIKKRYVELEIRDERKALERALLHFAHLKKQVEKFDDNHYLLHIEYDKKDETEILIRILSFGPMLKVIGPESFVDLIKKRLYDQIACNIRSDT